MSTRTRGRRGPTAAQRARAEEKRERMRQWARELGGLDEAGREALAERLGRVVTIEGHPLSVRNTIVCHYQRDGVSVVGGYQQWKQAGRQVRKGEQGIGIWTPGAERADEGGGEDADGVIDEKRRGPRYLVVTVFDISQTDAAEEV